MKLPNTTIVCDYCDHSIEDVPVESIKDYLHLPCPECGLGEIIDDEDLEVLEYIKELAAMTDEILQADPETEVVEVCINSRDYK